MSLLLPAVLLFATNALSADPCITDPVNPAFPDSTSREEPYMAKEFKLDGPGILNVFTLNGNIEVMQVPDTNNIVRVELYVDRGYAFWSDTKNLDNYRITMLQRGNEVSASVEQKTKGTGLFSDQITFSYKIYVPAQISTELKTTGGHVTLSGVKGTHIIKTGGGNINVRNITGKVSAYTTGGNIDIHSSEGTLYGRTEGGNITADNNSGELRLSAKGGWVKARRTSGSMLAEVHGGDIEASFLNVSLGIRLETTSGDIALSIPGSLGYDVEMRGTRVSTSSLSSFEGTRRSNFVEGTVNHGGALITLRSGSGTVNLKTEN